MYIPRIHVASIETCGCVASFERVSGKLTVWMTTQAPHAIRTVFSLVSKIPEHKIRVISPDIGGGFGGKVPVYPGYVCAVVAGADDGPARQVDRGPLREPPGRLVRPRLPHARRAGRRQGRQDDGAAHQDAGRPRLGRRRRQPVQVPGRPVLDLHRLLRHAQRARRGRRRLHQQAAGRRRLPLLVPRHRGRALHRAHGRFAGAQAEHGPGRAAPEELHPARAIPVQVGARLGVRLAATTRPP